MFINTKKFFHDKIPKDTNETFTQPYLQAFENSACIAKLGFNLQIKYANRLFSQLSLCTKSESLKKEIYDIFDNTDNVLDEIVETLKNLQTWDGTLSLRINSDNQAFVKCSIIPIIDNENIPQEYLLIAHDITELMISKRVIKDNIYLDSLTKLPNRIQLIKDKLKFSLKSELTLIILNIDSFQAINTIYGNGFGDEVLKIFSNWLKNNLPDQNTNLYKFESDVYAMLVPSKYDKYDLNNYLKNLNLKISKEGLQCREIDINLAFTIGIAQGRKNLLKLASIAYKEAKKKQENYIIHDPNNNKEEEYIRNTNMISVLKKAIQDDSMIPYFQPIMEISTKKINKYETLMRIKKGDNDVFLPCEFLDIAKHSKLYSTLSRSIIKKAFETFKLTSSEFAVNLSFLDISNKTTNKFIFDILSEYDIGSWVVFEILESEGINNYDMVLKFVETVKSFGAKIAIDDFGSGYSNFERILKLQPDYIKIDGSLIKNIDKNDDMKILTQTIVDFANKLNIKTIAEYVHSKEVLDTITKMGIDFAQGYYISKPLPKLCDTVCMKNV
ncbi:MAG: EAL domain-containing protein [Epsilonproteobacteria bacterium]|nr:EAL domain-containing protein [Campylobacterota bacterium]